MSFITTDWHIHSVASYDASLHVADLIEQADKQGLIEFGLADHVNLPSWIHYLKASAELVKQFQRPNFHLGVELTTISGYLEEYDRNHGSGEGFEHPGTHGVDPISFPLTAEELDVCGVEYVIGAGHWLLNAERKQDDIVNEMHRQNMFCATSPLVDIVGHPYYFYGTYENKYGKQVPFDDLSIIPKSIHTELYSAIRENDKIMEVNTDFFSDYYPESFRCAYAEFARAAFEYGIKVSIGTDCHGPQYNDRNNWCERYLGSVGFKSSDFSIPKFGKRKG